MFQLVIELIHISYCLQTVSVKKNKIVLQNKSLASPVRFTLRHFYLPPNSNIQIQSK